MPALFSEAVLEQAIIDKFKDEGYDYVSGDDLRRLNRPDQRTRIDQIKADPRFPEPVPYLLRLLPAGLIQRDVASSLQNICLILFRLSVADDVDHRFFLSLRMNDPYARFLRADSS